MIISATCMLFLCLFGFAQLIPRFDREDVFQYIAFSTVFSLYIAWCVFLVSYFTGFGQLLPVLSIPLALAALLAFIHRIRAGEVPLPDFAAGTGGWLIPVAGVIMVAMIVYKWFPEFGFTFWAWDALVSVNRWAIELANNTYAPYDTAYPLFVSAIWSLVYEAQGGTDLWMFSKALLPLFSLSVAALFLHIGFRRGVLPLAVLAITSYFGFFSNFSPEPQAALYTGYVDRPSALFGLAALLFAFEGLDRPEGRHRFVWFLAAIAMASIAVTTKQHGLFAALAVCGLIAFEFFRGRLSVKLTTALAGLFLFVPLTYLYIYLGVHDQIWGNFDHLTGLSEARAGPAGNVMLAFGHVRAELPDYIWPLIAIGIGLNLLCWRDKRAWFAGGVLAVAAPGFLVYAECCVYDPRNGIWMISHFVAASFIGWALLAERLARKGLVWPQAVVYGAQRSGAIMKRIGRDGAVMVLSAAIALSAGYFFNQRSADAMLRVQHDQQRWRPDYTSYLMITNAGINPASAQYVFTPVQPLRYHPDIGDSRYVYCGNANAGCFAIATAGDLFITADWFENDTTRAYLAELVESGHIMLLAAERGAYLYQFQAQ